MKVQTDKANGKKNIVKVIIAVIAVVLAGYCIFCLITNAADISRLKAENDELNTKYEQQVKENEKLKSILDSDNKDEYIEQKAREKGYVKDGEVVYYDISDSK